MQKKKAGYTQEIFYHRSTLQTPKTKFETISTKIVTQIILMPNIWRYGYMGSTAKLVQFSLQFLLQIQFEILTP